MNTKKLTTTAIFLALCIVFQTMKGFSTYITGSAVNTFLIMATLSCGLQSGIFISICTPFIAYLLGQTPILNFMPIMVLVIALGNATIVFFAYLGMKGKWSLPVSLVIGSLLKALVLWVLVSFVVIPIFGASVIENGASEMILMAAKASFSTPQAITALIGSGIAVLLHGRLKGMYPSD